MPEKKKGNCSCNQERKQERGYQPIKSENQSTQSSHVSPIPPSSGSSVQKSNKICNKMSFIQ